MAIRGATGRHAMAGRVARIGVGALLCAVLANCSGGGGSFLSQIDPRFGTSASPRLADGDAAQRGAPGYHIGKPYRIGGRTYVPQEDENYRAEGMASWYGTDFHGRRTANGETFDMHRMTAAHPTLPLPSYVRVTNLGNNRSIVLRVNDRGPYHGNRVVDISIKAADMLGFRQNGVARVRVEYVGRAPLEGSDDAALMATLREGTPAPAPSLVMVASSKPFVPALRTPAYAAAMTPLAGNVPTPPERPFELGLQ